MKKLLATLMAALMLVAPALTVPVFAANEIAFIDPAIAGEWFLTSMKEGGEEYDASVLSMLGMSGTLMLNEDGTASMNFSGEEASSGTWAFSDGKGAISFEDSLAQMVLEDDALVVTDGETTSMTFKREAPAEQTYEMAPAIDNPSLEDFNGTWKGTVVNMMGMFLPMNMLGGTMTMTIKDGQITYYSCFVNESADEEAEEMPEETAEEVAEPVEEDATPEGADIVEFTVQAELANGTLIAEGTEETDYTDIVLHLHEDGKLTNGYVVPAHLAEPETTAEGEEDENWVFEYYTVYEKVEETPEEAPEETPAQ